MLNQYNIEEKDRTYICISGKHPSNKFRLIY